MAKFKTVELTGDKSGFVVTKTALEGVAERLEATGDEYEMLDEVNSMIFQLDEVLRYWSE